MTLFFCFALLIVLFIVTFMPLRVIIIVSFTYTFNKGRSWNNRRLANNTEICKIEL